MSVITVPQAFDEEELYVDIERIFGQALLLKCEGFNFAGSIKLKAAAEMVAAAERDGSLTADSVLVESSSGNLGVALSMIAASKGYRFVCVTDSRCNLATRLMMEALGGEVHVVAGREAGGGLLGARLDHVRRLCARDDRYVWLCQYSNPGNWRAHFRTTAPEIARSFPRLDVLFVGAGTTGTLMGCARYFRNWHRPVRMVAVDTVGSVAFGGDPGRRMIPGLGMSMRPPLLDESYVDEVVRVQSADRGGEAAEQTGEPGLDQLMLRTADGDREAFTGVYDRTAGPVMGLVHRVLRDPAQSEEVVQEVLLEVWRTSGRFEPGRGSAMTWIMTLAHRRAVDRVRAAQAGADRERRAALLAP
ncbi:pyridoxal-phosphate dependent enzyme, partial [Streptomyces sp. P01-B04]